MRLGLSVLFPLGMGADLFPGMLAVETVKSYLGLDPHSFEGTLATTVVQGTFLNVILAVFMYQVYWFQRLFMKPPEAPQGFEVVMPAIAVAPNE